MGGKLKIISTISNLYSKCQLKIMQSLYKHLKCLPDIYSMPHRSRHHSLLHPLATVRHRTGRGLCNHDTFAEFHTHIQNTSPDRDVMLSGSHVF